MVILIYLSICLLSCVVNVHSKECSSYQQIAIVIDSTRLTTQKDFGSQKDFVHILYQELSGVLTNLSLIVQVYSDPETCSRLVTEQNRAFSSANKNKIRQKLDSLIYDNESDTEYDLKCVQNFVSTLQHVKYKKSGKINTSSLILAKYNSVKRVIGGSHIPQGDNSNDYLVFFLTKNGKQHDPPFVKKISDIQHFVSVIKRLICTEDESKIKHVAPPPSDISSSTRTTKLNFSKSSINNTFSIQASQLYNTPVMFNMTSSFVLEIPKPVNTLTSQIYPSVSGRNFVSMFNVKSTPIVNIPISGNKSSMNKLMPFTIQVISPSPVHLPSDTKTIADVNTTTGIPSKWLLPFSSVINTTYTDLTPPILPSLTNITKNSTNFTEFSSSLYISQSVSSTVTLKPFLVTTLNATISSPSLSWESPDVLLSTIPTFKMNSTKYIISFIMSSIANNMTTPQLLPSMNTTSTSLFTTTVQINATESMSNSSFMTTTIDKTQFNQTNHDNNTTLMTKSITFNMTSSPTPSFFLLVTSSISSLSMDGRNTRLSSLFQGKTTISATPSLLLETSALFNSPNTANIIDLKTELPPIYSTVLNTPYISSTTNLLPSSVIFYTSKASVLLPAIFSLFASSYTISSAATLQTVSSTVAVGNTTFVMPISPENPLKKDLKEFQEQEIFEESFKNFTWLENFVKKASNIIEKINMDNSSEILTASMSLMNYVEHVLVKVGKYTPTNGPRTIVSNALSIEVKSVNPLNFTGYQFSDNDADDEGILLPDGFFPPDFNSSLATIVAMTYKPLPVMQPTTNNIKVADKVFMISINPSIPVPFNKPFNYTITIQKPQNANVDCVYWNESDWITSGCRTFPSNGSSITCQCDHMTPFSVLMQVTDYEIPEEHRFALSIISYIGCGLSIFGCIVLILVFMMCGKLVKIDRNLIHINLAIAIALSNGLFIIADSVTKYKHVCLGVSIAMLYSFLSSFFWMLVEGMHVYLMVVKVFHSSRKMKVYLLIGWVIPAIIVTLAALKFHDDFVRPKFCWITTDHSLIWIFVGPALFVLSVNTIILIASLSASHKMCIDEFEFNRLRKIARLTLVLMPIFGLSWVFGVLAVNKELIVFQYLFTGLNSFQGVFLFVCYCLMNSEVKREYQRVQRRSQYSSKSNELADSGFSSYVQYQRGKQTRSSVLSTEDVPSTVYLTKFDHNGDFITYEEEPDAEYPESVSNTLTKKTHKKNYSIELLRLPKTGGSDNEDSYEDGDSTGLLKVVNEQLMFRSGSFNSNLSKNHGSSHFDDLDEDGDVYKTFQNTNDGTFVTAYQV